MNMTHETAVLKSENPDLLALLQKMQNTVCEAAHQGTPIHEVEKSLWQCSCTWGTRCLRSF